MQALRPPLMAATLGLRNLHLKSPIRARLAAFAVAGDRRVLAAQIDANGLLLCRSSLRKRHLHGHAQPPVAASVLGKAAISELRRIQSLAFEHANELAGELHAAAGTLDARGLKWHPSERTTRAMRAAPTQPDALCCPALCGILAIHALDGICTDALEILRSASAQIV